MPSVLSQIASCVLVKDLILYGIRFVFKFKYFCKNSFAANVRAPLQKALRPYRLINEFKRKSNRRANGAGASRSRGRRIGSNWGGFTSQIVTLRREQTSCALQCPPASSLSVRQESTKITLNQYRTTYCKPHYNAPRTTLKLRKM